LGGTHSRGGRGGLRHLRGDLATTQAGADDLWHRDDLTVELAAGDAAGSGVDVTQYRVDGGEWTDGTMPATSRTRAAATS